MWSGRVAGGADGADALALLDFLPLGDTEAGHMHVDGIHTAAMVDHHVVSGRGRVGRDHDLTAGSRHNLRAAGCRDVDALMIGAGTLGRRFTGAEGTADASPRRNRPGESAAHRSRRVVRLHLLDRIRILTGRDGRLPGRLFLRLRLSFGLLPRLLFLPFDFLLHRSDRALLLLDVRVECIDLTLLLVRRRLRRADLLIIGGELLVLLCEQGRHTLLLRARGRLHCHQLRLLRLELQIRVRDKLLRRRKLVQLLAVILRDLRDVLRLVEEICPAFGIQDHVDEARIILLVHEADAQLHAGILVRLGLRRLGELPLRELDVQLLLRDGRIKIVHLSGELCHALVERFDVARGICLPVLEPADGIIHLRLLFLQRIDGRLIRVDRFLRRRDLRLLRLCREIRLRRAAEGQHEHRRKHIQFH